MKITLFKCTTLFVILLYIKCKSFNWCNMLTPSLHKKLAAIFYQTSIYFLESIKTNAHLCKNKVQISTYCDIMTLESRICFTYTKGIPNVIYVCFITFSELYIEITIHLVTQNEIIKPFSAAKFIGSNSTKRDTVYFCRNWKKLFSEIASSLNKDCKLQFNGQFFFCSNGLKN